jgi:hypothetical protein
MYLFVCGTTVSLSSVLRERLEVYSDVQLVALSCNACEALVRIRGRK